MASKPIHSEIQLKSCTADEQALLALLTDTLSESATAVIWQYQKIIFGQWDGKQLFLPEKSKFSANLVEELRVFHSSAELHLLREDGRLFGRLRKDSDGTDDECVDVIAPFWGVNAGRSGSYVSLRDADRKLQLVIPCEEESERYGLVTRSYIGRDENNGQAGYTDYRYVQITSADAGKEHG